MKRQRLLPPPADPEAKIIWGVIYDENVLRERSRLRLLRLGLPTQDRMLLRDRQRFREWDMKKTKMTKTSPKTTLVIWVHRLFCGEKRKGASEA